MHRGQVTCPSSHTESGTTAQSRAPALSASCGSKIPKQQCVWDSCEEANFLAGENVRKVEASFVKALRRPPKDSNMGVFRKINVLQDGLTCRKSSLRSAPTLPSVQPL